MAKDNLDQEKDIKETSDPVPEGDNEDGSEESPQEKPEESPQANPEESPQEKPEENQAPTGEDDISHEESGETGGNSVKSKIGVGPLVLGILIAFIVVLGARHTILGWFSGGKKVEAPKSVVSKLNDPVKDTELQQNIMPTQQDVVSPSQAVDPTQQGVVVPPQAVQLPSAPVNTMTEEGVKGIVKNFILNNPELIIESLTKFEQKANEQKTQQSKEYLNKSGDTLSKGKPFMGNRNGKINIVEFFDYQCGHCKRSHSDLVKLTQAYPNLKISLVQLPFMGPSSAKAVKFSLAVNNLYPDKFHAFHADLIQSDSINDEVIFKLIGQHGLDKNKLIEEANSDKIESIIRKNLELAQLSGVRGVPSFVINGEFIPGAANYRAFKEKIDLIQVSG